MPIINGQVIRIVSGGGADYTVTFDSKGGTEVTAKGVISGNRITEPIEPTKTDFLFRGWHTDDTTFLNKFDFDTPITADVTLYALWRDDVFRWGMKIDKNNSNPTTRVSYLFDAVDKTPAVMNYVSTQFDYGDWQDFCEMVNRPVMLKADGTVDYALDRSDQTLKAGGGSSDVANTAYVGNAMSEFKLLWLREYEDTDYMYIIFSNVQYDEDYHADAFTHGTTVQDVMYMGMFESVSISSKHRSLSGQTPTASQTGAVQIEQSEENGDGWYIHYKSQRDFITYLLWLISKSTYDKEKFGQGNQSTTAYVTTGTMVSTGQFNGLSTDVSAIKTFYIENFWGNYQQRMAGMLMDSNNQIWVQTKAPYTIILDTANTGHSNTGVTLSGTSGTYIYEAQLVNNAFVPDVLGADADKNFTSGAFYSSPAVGSFRYALAGGNRNNGLRVGASYVNLNNGLSNSNTNNGSVLTYLIWSLYRVLLSLPLGKN